LFFLVTSMSSILGNSFIIDTTKIYNKTSNWQRNSKVAFDGTNFLVIWEDIRKDEYSQIRGCRISQNGQILDKGGFAISLAEPYTFRPSLAYDGTNYLVVWRGSDYISGYPRQAINAARVTSFGELLDSIPILISEPYSGGWKRRPTVASSGINCLVVWNNAPAGYPDIYGARVSSQGTLLDSTPVFISTDANNPSHPAISYDGINYMVVWEDFEGFGLDSCHKFIRGARIAEDGTIIDTIPLTFITYSCTTFNNPYIKEFSLNPILYFGLENYLLVWNIIDLTGDFSQNIYGCMISPDGVVLDTNYISISNASGNQIFPSLAFDGSEFLVAWEDFRNASNGFKPAIYFTKIDTSGIVLDTIGKPLLTNTTTKLQHPSVSYGGGEYLVSFTDRRGNPFKYAIDDDIYVSRVDITGSPIDSSGIPITLSTQHQRMPAVGFDGENHLVVWEDERGEDIDLYGALIDTSGNILTPPGVFPVSQAKYKQLKPKVDFVNPYYLVVWQDYRDADWITRLYGTRVTKDGIVLDPDGIYFDMNDAMYIFNHQISNDSTNFLIVWQKWDETYPAHSPVVAVRVDTSGVFLDPEGIIIDTSAWFPSVSFDGENWLVCYLNICGLVGVRLSSDGTVITPLFVISSQFYVYAKNPSSITFNGNNYFVTWASRRNESPLDENIHGSRASPDGYDLDSVDIIIANKPEYHQYAPQTASCGGNFFVVWLETRNFYPYTGWSYCTKSIYGTYVSPDGVVLDTNGILFTPPLAESKSPAVTWSNGDRFLLCYSGFAESPYGSYRIYGRFIDALINVEESKKRRDFVNRLAQNFPNPFTKSTVICYQVKEKGFVELSIYNAAGRLIKKIVNERKNPGIHTVRWNGKNTNENLVSNGIYFYKLKLKDFRMTRKMLFIQ
ncbi:MAG: T9SS type A sorting domain-containing protein, partial [Candidatus Cloacimonadota bacterium]